METMEKPRLKYSPEHFAARANLGYPEWSVAWVIQLFIDEMNGKDGKRPIKPLGESHQYLLERLQRQPIGKVDARKLTEEDLIEHCKARRETVCAATVNQDIGYLQGAMSYIRTSLRGPDAKAIAAPIFQIARKFLVKNGYIGKSTPRKRVPTDAELEQLLARAALPPKRPHSGFIYALPDIIAFALASSRRLGEICRITHSDVDLDHMDEKGNPAPIYWVRDMKHPTKKKGNDKAFTLWPELAEIIRRQPRKAGDDRIFPFRKESVGARFTRLKAEMGIQDLHFHDCRREAITNWLKKLTPHQVRKFVSGHDNGTIFDRVYDATDPAGGHALVNKQEARA